MPSAARPHEPARSFRSWSLLRIAFVVLIPSAAVAARWAGGPAPASLPALVTAPALAAQRVQTPPTSAPVPPSPAAPSVAAFSPPITVEALPTHERVVELFNVNTSERARFRIGARGYVRAEEVAAVDHFFRCRRTDRQRAIDPGVLMLLADISERWPGHEIEIISGFRAPPFGAPHSRHFTGHAIDLRVKGVRTAAVRDFVWREHKGVGVGHYAEEDFVHVDSRDQDDEIAWSAPEEDSVPQYNPRWAKRARRGVVAAKRGS